MTPQLTSVAMKLKTMALPLTRVFCSGALPWSLSPAFPKLSHPLCALYVDVRGTKGEDGEVPAAREAPSAGHSPPHSENMAIRVSDPVYWGHLAPEQREEERPQPSNGFSACSSSACSGANSVPTSCVVQRSKGSRSTKKKEKLLPVGSSISRWTETDLLDKQFACTNLATIHLFKL